MRDELLELERRGWEALCASDEEVTAFYGEVLAEDVRMLLPGGMVLTGRDEALAAMGASWTTFELTDGRVLELTDDVGVVTYGARATADGGDYDALLASTYVRREGAWRLVVHQQTPV